IRVFGGQILEGRVGLLGKANDLDILLEIADRLAGLIGKRIELFSGEIDALVMAETEIIAEAENDQHQKRDGDRISAQLGRTNAEEGDEFAVTERQAGEEQNTAAHQQNFA